MNDGGPAFPRPCAESNHFENDAQDGMSLRDYFAAAALTGLLAADSNSDPELPDMHIGKAAYQIADAMIAARSKAKEQTT